MRIEFKFNLLHILTLIFVVAKLFNFVQWSWWLVFLPSIISVGVGLLLLALILILATLDAL